MATHTTKPKHSDRKQEHATMLKEALARPGIREVMQVYQNYQKADKGLDTYRLATKQPGIVETTDHANAQ